MRNRLKVVAVLIGIYLVAYLSLVKPAPMNDAKLGTGPVFIGPPPRDAEFRMGGAIAGIVFPPIHMVDRQVRRSYWLFTEDEWNAAIEQKMRRR